MKWLYLFLAVGAVLMLVVALAVGTPEQKSRALKVCTTAAIVNGALFYLLHRTRPTAPNVED